MASATAAVCLGLSVTGTPRVQRRLEADNRRIQELRTIAGIISNSATLPPSLEQFGMTDPETKKPYEYLSKTGDRYELCAAFTAANEVPPYGSNWAHPTGRACFAFARTRPVPW